MEDIFRRLSGAHVNRKDLYLAWDFTVASAHSLSGRLLGIRDDAFRELGDKNLGDLKVKGASPRFSLSKVSNFAPCGSDGCQAGEDDIIQRRVEGTVEVPCYLDRTGCPASSRFKLGPDGQPLRTPGNVYHANFICNIPRSVTSATPGACRSTATACSAAPARSTASAASRSPRSTEWCCAPPTGSACRVATWPTRSRSSGTCPASRSWPTGSSRGCSTSCFSAAR